MPAVKHNEDNSRWMKDELLYFISRFIAKPQAGIEIQQQNLQLEKKEEVYTSILLYFSNFFKGPIMCALQKTLASKLSKKDGLFSFLGGSLTGYYF